MDVGQNGRPLMGPEMWMSSLVLTIHNFGVPNFDPYPNHYIHADAQRTFMNIFAQSIHPVPDHGLSWRLKADISRTQDPFQLEMLHGCPVAHGFHCFLHPALGALGAVWQFQICSNALGHFRPSLEAQHASHCFTITSFTCSVIWSSKSCCCLLILTLATDVRSLHYLFLGFCFFLESPKE